MNDERRKAEALFRHSVIGPLLVRDLRRGELQPALEELARQSWTGPDGRPREISWRTLEDWYYRYKREGFDALAPETRSDAGTCRVLDPEVRELVLAMKREDPGRSAPLILEELENAGRLERGQVSVATIQRLLKRSGFSGAKLELDRPERLRWQASECGELWQADCCHGPKLFDPRAGKEVRVKIFGLIDDRSRLVPYARADFHESQAEFLAVLLGAVKRRGVPRILLADNHGSFTGPDTQIACAKLGIRLTFARPYDGPAKGKIERWWRHLRGRVLDRLDLEKVKTLDDLNVRLSAWIEGEYNNKPHSSLGGRTPLEVWEEDAEQVRWIEDMGRLEAAFVATLTRSVRNDSTIQIDGATYEVPSHFRGQKVTIGRSLLRPDVLWLEDGATRVPIRLVEPEANAERSRRSATKTVESPAAKTGMNAVEDLLRRITRPLDGAKGEGHVA